MKEKKSKGKRSRKQDEHKSEPLTLSAAAAFPQMMHEAPAEALPEPEVPIEQADYWLLRRRIEFYLSKTVLPILSGETKRLLLRLLTPAPQPLNALHNRVDHLSLPAVQQHVSKLAKAGLAEKKDGSYSITLIGRTVLSMLSEFPVHELKPFTQPAGAEKRMEVLIRLHLNQKHDIQETSLNSLANQLQLTPGYLHDLLSSLIKANLLHQGTEGEWGTPYRLSERGLEFINSLVTLNGKIANVVLEQLQDNTRQQYTFSTEHGLKPLEEQPAYILQFDGSKVKLNRHAK